MVDLRANIPEIQYPFLDQGGRVSTVWFQFLLKLFDRTGGGLGSDGSGDHSLIIDTLGLLNSYTAPVTSTGQLQRILALSQSPIAAKRPFVSYEVSAHGIQFDPILHAIASQQANGFMSSGDKAKLDGITAGAAISGITGTLPIVISGTTAPVVSINAATQALPGSMSAADKAKLDNLRPTVVPVSTITSPTVTNSTADLDVLSITIPANALTTGSVLRSAMYGIAAAAAAGGALNLYVKISTTKIITIPLTAPAAAMASNGFSFDVGMTVRGTSPVLLRVSGRAITQANLMTPANAMTTADGTFDPTVSNTITIGFSWSVANAANTATSQSCFIVQDK